MCLLTPGFPGNRHPELSPVSRMVRPGCHLEEAEQMHRAITSLILFQPLAAECLLPPFCERKANQASESEAGPPWSHPWRPPFTRNLVAYQCTFQFKDWPRNEISQEKNLRKLKTVAFFLLVKKSRTCGLTVVMGTSHIPSVAHFFSERTLSSVNQAESSLPVKSVPFLNFLKG